MLIKFKSLINFNFCQKNHLYQDYAQFEKSVNHIRTIDNNWKVS